MKDSYLSDEELKAFIATLPTRRLAAGALIRNERGEMLLVKPNYKDGWILPGGTVEAGEAPKPGCEREIVEELGLDVKLGRVLLIFHGLALGVWGDWSVGPNETTSMPGQWLKITEHSNPACTTCTFGSSAKRSL